MAVTQYIGARYVPKIYDNPDDNTNKWKQGVEYEPLTMVSYAGGSYTSKVPVPASAANPADAPQYWAYMGSSSGQITTNTNNISRIQHAIANATEAGYVCTTARAAGDYVWIDGTLYRCTAAVDVNDSYIEGINVSPVTDMATALNVIQEITADVSNIQDDILGINSSLTTLDGKISDLETEIPNPYTLCIGDSYAAGWTPDGDNAGWPSYLFDLGVRGETLAVGGAGFHYDDTNDRSFLKILTNASLSVADDKIQRIIVCAGYNDLWDRGNLRTRIRSFISYTSARFINAKIYIGFCGYAWSGNENNIQAFDLHSAIRDYEIACRWSKAVFMPQVIGVLCGVTNSMASDYKHPNENGNRCIANAIYAALSGCSYESSSDYTISLTDTNNGTSGSIALAVTVKDGSVFARARSLAFTIERSSTFAVNQINFTPPHFPILPFALPVKIGEIIRNFNTSAGNLSKSYYHCPSYLYFNSPGVVAMTQLINDSGDNFGSTTKFEVNDSHDYTSVGSF